MERPILDTKSPPYEFTAHEFIDVWNGGWQSRAKSEYFSTEEIDDKRVIVFDNIIVNEDILILNLKNLPKLIIKNSRLKNFEINASYTSDIQIQDDSFINDISISEGAKIGHIVIKKSKIEDIYIRNSSTKNISIIESSDIKSVNLNGEINTETDGNSVPLTTIEKFIIESSICKYIDIRNLEAKYFNIELNSYLDSITISNLKATFFNVTGSKLRELDISKSNLERVEILQSALGMLKFGLSSIDYFKVESSIFEEFLNRSLKGMNFKFSNVIASKIQFIELSININIDFLNLTTKSLLIIKSSILAKDLTIENACIDELSIKNTTLNYIKITNAILTDFSISEASKSKDIKILNSSIFTRNSISKGFHILQSNIGDLTFIRAKMYVCKIIDSNLEKILIENESTIFDLKITDSTVRNFKGKKSRFQKIHLDKSTIQSGFSIKDNCEIYWFLTEGKDIRKIAFEQSYIQLFEWKQDTICMVNVEKCKIEKLLLEKCAIPKDSIFQINDSLINQFWTINFVNTAWLNISNLKPLDKYSRFVENPTKDKGKSKYLQINVKSKSINFGTIKIEGEEKDIKGLKLIYEFVLIEEKKETSIQLINSDMGKASFVNSKLDSFKKFVFYNSKMLEVFVAGTKFPTEIKVVPVLTEKLKYNEETEQKRLAFGQFKKIYENRGDSVTAMEFLALELQQYRYQLKNDIESSNLNLCNKMWWNIRGEQANLGLNRFSSYYGNNWIRATLITLIINFILFWIYCLFIGYRIGSDYDKFLNLLSYSFEFLNPLRKVDFIDTEKYPHVEKSIDWAVRSWDYISRIFIAYFVYQTIQAFRRFGKK